MATRERRGLRTKKINWKHYHELEVRLRQIIDDVNCSVSAVIVEGKRDEEALRSVGLKRPVIRFSSSGLPVFAFVDEVADGYRGSNVLLLLDFDQEGNEMAEHLSQELEEGGVRVERALRREVVKLLIREGVLHIEEIGKLLRKSSL